MHKPLMMSANLNKYMKFPRNYLHLPPVDVFSRNAYLTIWAHERGIASYGFVHIMHSIVPPSPHPQKGFRCPSRVHEFKVERRVEISSHEIN